MKFEFITNDLTVKNNRSLKNRGQFGIEMEIERALLPQVLGLEAWPEGSHFKITVEPIENDHNGYEKSLLRDPAKPKGETIYKRFKRIAIDYSGEDYYNRLKKHLGVEHLRDLEKNHSLSMVEDLLRLQVGLIERRISGHLQTKESIISLLTHKDNAYKVWLELFDNFNNPKE